MTNTSAVIYFDGVFQDELDNIADLTSFSSVTLFLGGYNNGGATILGSSSDFVWDDVAVVAGGVNRVVNGGFESAVTAPTTSIPFPSSTGNWSSYYTATRQSSVVHSGGWAGQVANSAGAQTLWYQDIALGLAAGDPLVLVYDLWVRRSSGIQRASIYLDSDRGGPAVDRPLIELTFRAGNTDVFVNGSTGSVPALPVGQWTNVVVRCFLNIEKAEAWAASLT